jgi:hypothetical protein
MCEGGLWMRSPSGKMRLGVKRNQGGAMLRISGWDVVGS